LGAQLSTAPIALFTYSRLNHTRKTVEALLKNTSASSHDLIIFSDAARTPKEQNAVDDVRAYLKSIEGFRSITINLRPQNFGLSKSIIDGVTQVLSEHEKIIVLEDDMEASPYFLDYMNAGLDRFSEDDRVISIHAYTYPVKVALPEVFFLRGADCWGWATWKRAWSIFNPDGKYLLDELKKKKLIKSFNYNNNMMFSEMLSNQIRGLNDSWAIRWHASAYLKNKLTLYPGISLISNIGNDGTGRHCPVHDYCNVTLSKVMPQVGQIEVRESMIAYAAFEDFYKKINILHYKNLGIFSKFKKLIKNALIKMR
jgi:hypothetical protein